MVCLLLCCISSVHVVVLEKNYPAQCCQKHVIITVHCSLYLDRVSLMAAHCSYYTREPRGRAGYGGTCER